MNLTIREQFLIKEAFNLGIERGCDGDVFLHEADNESDNYINILLDDDSDISMTLEAQLEKE